MKCLVIDDEPELLDLVGFILENDFRAEVIRASSGNQAIEILRTDPSIEFVISDYAMPDGNGVDVFRYLRETGKTIPYVLCSAYDPEDIEFFRTTPPDAFVPKGSVVVSLRATMLELTKRQASAAPHYARVRADTLLRLGTASSDVYLQLSDQKYVKVLHEGEAFDANEHARFTAKKAEWLFIPVLGMEKLLKRLHQRLIDTRPSLQAASQLDCEIRLSTRSLEVVADFNRAFGLTPEVQDLIRAGVEQARAAIAQNRSLQEILGADFMTNEAYIPAHSVVLAHLAGSLAALMGWVSEQTFRTLALAAFFHDLTLENNELAKLSSTELMRAWPERFAQADRNEYMTHPTRSAKLAATMEDMPPEVETVILQHHELPNGQGFPEMLDAARIHPLASVFIVAHELLDFHLELKSAPDLMGFVLSREEGYGEGTFRKALRAIMDAAKVD